MSMSPRRSTRISNAPQRYEANFMAFMLSLVDSLPKSFDEASHSKEHGKYMHVEYGNLMKDDVWNLVDFSKEKVISISCHCL